MEQNIKTEERKRRKRRQFGLALALVKAQIASVTTHNLVKANYYTLPLNFNLLLNWKVFALRTYSQEITTTTGAAQKLNQSEIDENSTGDTVTYL